MFKDLKINSLDFADPNEWTFQKHQSTPEVVRSGSDWLIGSECRRASRLSYIIRVGWPACGTFTTPILCWPLFAVGIPSEKRKAQLRWIKFRGPAFELCKPNSHSKFTPSSESSRQERDAILPQMHACGVGHPDLVESIWVLVESKKKALPLQRHKLQALRLGKLDFM